MGYMHEFPHTSNFDSDLSQILELYMTVKNLPKEWESYKTALTTNFNDLKSFVNNYFDNLDVSNEINAKLQAMYEDGTLAESIAQSRYAKFANKHICIIGDSISDNTTNSPNWTVEFTNEVAKVGATVTNLAANGSSFAGWANNQQNILASIPKADVYIVFLGINDFQGQFPWTGGKSVYEASACAVAVFNHIINTNVNADYYYISPIKILRTATQKYAKPLIYYRALYESIANSMGFTVISGYNAPQLSAFNPNKLSDTLHPTSAYGAVLAQYILNAMISGVSTFTPFTRLVLEGVFQPTAGNGFCPMTVDNNFNAQINVNVVNFPLSIGWNTVCPLNDAFTTFPVLGQSTVYNPLSDKHYQVQISADGLQVYARTTETTNLDFVVKWNNRWNGRIINE